MRSLARSHGTTANGVREGFEGEHDRGEAGQTEDPYELAVATERQLLIRVIDKLDEMEIKMATQDQVNALAARIEASIAGIRQDLDELKAANPDLDLSALEAKVADLEGLDAENPVPPVEQ